MMDKLLRRAPDAEWTLMYRLGLSRARIAELVRVHPATVGYHLVIARWLAGRRREAAQGILNPAYRDGLAQVPDWAGNHRTAADEARWHDRLAGLVDFRQEGNDSGPRHHDYDSEREHTLGVWIHIQRYKRRRGQLNPVKLKLLDERSPDGRPAGPGDALRCGDRSRPRLADPFYARHPVNPFIYRSRICG